MHQILLRGPEEVSPPLRRLGGMSKSVVSRLQNLAERFGEMLGRACRALGASSFSVGVGYPFGLSVGLSW